MGGEEGAGLTEEFVPGETVICVPVMPGLEDLAGREGVVKARTDPGKYKVRFGRTKIVTLSVQELKRPVK